MWESAAGSGEGAVLPDSSRKSEDRWCWFGAARKFRELKQPPNRVGYFQKTSTVIPVLVKEAAPLRDIFLIERFDGFHNISQDILWDTGVVWHG